MPDDDAMDDIIETQIRYRWSLKTDKQKMKIVKQYLRETYGVARVGFLPNATELWKKVFG